MKLKKILAFILVALMISSAVIMTSCSGKSGSSDDTAKGKGGVAPQEVESEEVTETEAESDSEAVDETGDETEIVELPSDDPIFEDPTIHEEQPDAVIESEYFEFEYFDEWSENVNFVTESSDDRYEVRCYGTGVIDGFHCFSIIFADCSEMEDHYYLGDYNSTPVYTYVNQDFSSLNEEQINLINDTVLSYYMNELNYQLQSAEGFVISR